jgi:hypothetical protein
MVLTQTSGFAADWRRLGLGDEDLRALESAVMQRPERGSVMRGTGGLRKVRFAPPSWHTGKSGAVRVCYAWFPSHARVYFVALFAKNEKANLSAAERQAAAAYARRIANALETGDPGHA